jgi:hypothetical protein
MGDPVKRCVLVFLLGVAACAAPAPRAQPAPEPARKAPDTVRYCVPAPDDNVPDLAVNFDVFVATSNDLLALFPGSLPPRSAPRAKSIREVHSPFTGELIAGPFDPPLVIQSYEPDGPWPTSHGRFDLAEASTRRLPWVQCGGLHPDGFEALGDALGLPRPPANAVESALGALPERLTTPIFPPPESFGRVHAFPKAFLDALVAARDTSALGASWSQAFRARRLEQLQSAKISPPNGHEEPPPDPERLRPYFTQVAKDIVELARIAASTGRNLYVHHWPD